MEEKTTGEYPLFPELSDDGKKEAQMLIDSFKKEMEKVASATLMSLYADIVPYIESDSWNNFRVQLMSGFRNYNNRKIPGEFDFKTIRAEIFKQFKDDMSPELNQDIWEENKQLKLQIEHLEYILNHR